jgi:hypothetical protein
MYHYVSYVFPGFPPSILYPTFIISAACATNIIIIYLITLKYVYVSEYKL